MCSKVVTGYIEVYKFVVGALDRNYQGIASGDCLKIVLEQALESSCTENLPIWHFITNFADLKEDPHLFVTEPPAPHPWCLHHSA